MSAIEHNLLTNVSKSQEARSARVSSWDHSGKNEDAWVIKAGESAVLADLEGPGAITHIWFVQTCRRIVGPGLMKYNDVGVAMSEIHNAIGVNWEVMDEGYYRKVLIKIYWDDQETPSVVAPVGDFFCVGHSMAANFQSIPFTVSVKPSEQLKYGGAAALNCYLTMPFNKRAKIVIENQNDIEYFQYFYVDYELYPRPLSDDTLYFHAHWKRENPTKGWGPNLQTNSKDTMVPNLDGTGNYVILETQGKGNFIGCNHSVTHFQDTWWGEGDDMIWIDDDPEWPPSFHGTGGEDYFNQGWGMQKNAYPFCGTIIHEDDVPRTQVSYRWHLTDPIRFNKKIKVTMEHGHGNHLSDDWSTTAYWYQTLPSPKLNILPVDERLPRKPVLPAPPMEPPNLNTLDSVKKQKHLEHNRRFREFLDDRSQWIERRAEDSKVRSIKNIEIAKDIRTRYLNSLK
ncbi:hypothetical protein TRICI_005049 [Trichomonascus ciferrii]|uniref:DUF2961 domain-containing protein n=1 Tax=Trichomonascus ciferrii TaxID=44093 RepID=A0A642V1A7_9ASCO|nr:hypothetical protein TRICI_005049 [Trichomonascus ciferrii]